MQAHLNVTLIITLSGKQMFQPHRLTNSNGNVLFQANWSAFLFAIHFFLFVVCERLFILVSVKNFTWILIMQ